MGVNLSDYTGSMTAAEVGRAIHSGWQSRNKPAIKAPTVKPVGSATLTVNQASSAYTSPAVIPKESNLITHQCGSLSQVSESFPDNQYISADGNVSGDNTRLTYTLSFYLYSDSLEFIYKQNAARVEIFADGESVADTDVMVNGGLIRHARIEFTETKLRRIDMRCWRLYFGGLKIPNTATIYPVNPGKKVIVMGDSFTEGAGSGNQLFGFVSCINWMLGEFNYWNSGSGGTGYVNANSGAGRVDFISRLQSDVLDYNPDLLIVPGGINDIGFTDVTTFSAAVDAFYSLALTQLKPDQIVICSTFWPGSGTTPIEFSSVLKAKALEIGCHYIDFVGDGSNGYFTGTGTEGIPAANGNADVFISSDGTHPTAAGHLYLAHRLISDLSKLGLI